jgi:hypothetical protein
MTEFFKARDNFKPRERKPYTVTIEGKTIEVTHQKILEIQASGIQNWMLENNEIVKKPIKKTGRIFNELKKTAEGYTFLNNDPYWPTEINGEGYTWQTPSE